MPVIILVRGSVSDPDNVCSGYPGAPEVLPSHPLIEQSPGFGHPYLPSDDTDIEVDHFLWTGDIASDEVSLHQAEDADEVEVETDKGHIKVKIPIDNWKRHLKGRHIIQ